MKTFLFIQTELKPVVCVRQKKKKRTSLPEGKDMPQILNIESESRQPPERVCPNMHKNRIDPRAGFVNIQNLPKGPNGRSLCRYCSNEVPKGCRSYCSEACVTQWKILTNPGFVRKLVYRRDCGICARCGIHCDQQKPIFREALRYYLLLARWLYCPTGQESLKIRAKAQTEGEKEFRTQTGWPSDFVRSWWEAHHIHAVVEGGGGCGLDNYETICVPCHKKETALLRVRLKNNHDSQNNQCSIGPSEG